MKKISEKRKRFNKINSDIDEMLCEIDDLLCWEDKRLKLSDAERDDLNDLRYQIEVFQDRF